jgi:hypothetical protein
MVHAVSGYTARFNIFSHRYPPKVTNKPLHGHFNTFGSAQATIKHSESMCNSKYLLILIFSYLEFLTMGEVQTSSNSACCKSSSDPFRFNNKTTSKPMKPRVYGQNYAGV